MTAASYATRNIHFKVIYGQWFTKWGQLRKGYGSANLVSCILTIQVGNPHIKLVGLVSLNHSDLGHVRGVPTKAALKVPHYWEWEENLEGSEQEAFLDFMRSMLRWLPEDRLSAEELLQHKWLEVE